MVDIPDTLSYEMCMDGVSKHDRADPWAQQACALSVLYGANQFQSPESDETPCGCVSPTGTSRGVTQELTRRAFPIGDYSQEGTVVKLLVVAAIIAVMYMLLKK
jgi:hypothetical protein